MRLHTLRVAGALLIGLAPFAAGCIADDGTDLGADRASILGGTNTKVGDFPSVVAVDLGGGLCTGTLISPTVVITAAHCVNPTVLMVSSQAQVTAMTRAVFDDPAVLGAPPAGAFAVMAKSTFFNPAWDPNNIDHDDIGAIILQTPVTDRMPSPYNTDASKAMAGISVTQVGYGANNVNNIMGSAGTEHTLLNKKTTSCSTFGENDAILLCYDQTNGTGKCEGDSGGPSFLQIGGVNTLVGITSFGDQACKQLGADTKVSSQVAFIEMALNGGSTTPVCTADSTCNPSCGKNGNPVDPDCAACGMDGMCDAACGKNGNPPDPDCLNCGADNHLQAGCGMNGNPIDADNLTFCGADNICTAGCAESGAADPDCGGNSSGGCAIASTSATGTAAGTGGAGAGAAALLGFLAVVGAGATARRRARDRRTS